VVDARVDVWWCAECDEEWTVPSIPHQPECPRCGTRGWWRRFLNGGDAPPPATVQQLEILELVLPGVAEPVLEAIRDRAVLVIDADAVPELPAVDRAALRLAGFWELQINCDGEPDPGQLAEWFPGEKLEAVVAMIEQSGTVVRAETLARVRSEVAEWLRRTPL
jgi:hypothetical protein